MRVRPLCLCVLAGVLLWSVPGLAQVDPSPLIAPVVFHWPQAQTAWPTLEGGPIAAGSLRFWRRQLKLFETAGFTGQLFQVVYAPQTPQRNHLQAMCDLRAERPSGPLPPRIVPFFAAESFPEYAVPKNVLSPQGFEIFYHVIRGFFSMYAEFFPDPQRPGRLNPELLAKVDGRIFIGLWWVPLTDNNLPGTFFDRLNDRLEADFGFRAYWSAHDTWQRGNPDDLNYLFNGNKPVQRGRNPTHPSVDLLVAFWPPDPVNYRRDDFVPRDGGRTYVAAWNAVIASQPRPEIVLIESYNEISEGSHLMASWPIEHGPGDGHWTGPGDDPRCQYVPCHPVEYTDTWGSANPWHYLDLTRQKIREWVLGPAAPGVDLVPPHVFILTPKTEEGGAGAIELKVVAADDTKLREVSLYLDGYLLLRTTGTIDRLLKTWYLSNGRHRLFVEAFDEAGNRDEDTSDFIVQNLTIRLSSGNDRPMTVGGYGSCGPKCITR